MTAATAGLRMAVLVVAAAAGLATPVLAQDAAPTRVPVTIDYVSADGLYLTVGADQGANLGDTLAVFADSLSTASIGRLVLTSVTRRRSVARILDSSLDLERGEVFFAELRAPPATASAPTETSPAAPRDAQRTAGVREARTGARLSGRLALDFDARATRTSWSGDLFGETHRTFATPTTRLSLTASELPGGFTVRANLRASYRYDALRSGPPPVSMRAYELSATKEFESLPLVLMMGRFTNPYERYSAYWDGVLIRVGGTSGLGVGAVAGFEPALHNERFSGALPKVTGFADYSARGGAWRYDTDVSVHLVRPTEGVDRSHAGWSQRITLGPVDVAQRLRLDGGLDGRAWSVGDIRLRAGLAVGGPVRLRGTYGRSRTTRVPASAVIGIGDLPLGPVREERTVGMDVRGRRASVSMDAGRTWRDGSNAGFSLSGTAGLRVGGGGIRLAGQRWSRGAAQSLSLAPSIDANVAGLEWRTGYRYYRTDGGLGAIMSHAVEAQVGFDLANGFHLGVRAQRQWGRNLGGTGLHLGIWRSF